ncbi:MAG: hypothetical protein KC643_33850, partial [Nitrospira sp.]|nr:hypothetical protein [Nitrospira sp.]
MFLHYFTMFITVAVMTVSRYVCVFQQWKAPGVGMGTGMLLTLLLGLLAMSPFHVEAVEVQETWVDAEGVYVSTN